MLRIIQNTSSGGAKRYFRSADYYSEGQELVGLWRGKSAQKLGLEGQIQGPDWEALCDNLDLGTGERLTARVKGTRRVGYDFNFHPPKSVSLLYGLTGDERILEAFRSSVDLTMKDMEAEVQTRVRSKGRNEDRTTGNLVWGEYIHFTSRPVDGVPDPQLHAHCFAFNATYDEAESRWKAGQFAGVKRDAPYFSALFHARLARSLAELGLPVERTRSGWEIAGLNKGLLDRFSRRTTQIESLAAERGITDPAKKDALGSTTRQKKAKDLPMPALRAIWDERLSGSERRSLQGIGHRIGGPAELTDPAAAREAVDQSVLHCFERRAVVPERTLAAEALKRSAGKASAADVVGQVAALPLIRRERAGQRLVTTQEVLAEETRMLNFARQGRASCRPLGPKDHRLEREWLSADQKRAVRHILESPDRVILVRGAAGTGKTTMMQEAVAGIQAGGKGVFTFAPSAAASRGVLRSEGFPEAETVARLLADPDLQERVRGQVLWIDEAGLLGSRTTGKLFELAERVNARLILSGDRRQHGSVERGGVLRLLEDNAGLAPAELREIKRQSGEYKKAVHALGEGKVAEGFKRLDELGWVREIGAGQERYRALADAYLGSIAQPGQTLVVSPTHLEAERITTEVRSALKAAGKLAKDEREVVSLRPVNLTEAERGDPVSYLPGDVLVFHQNAKGHVKGSRLRVGQGPVPTELAARFTVFRPETLRLAKGDRVRITRNTKGLDGKGRLNNGELFTLKGFTKSGDLMLNSGAVLSRNDGHVAHGYVVTSHASQGRSVERVIIGQSSDSLRASSKEQFYVSVSRGKQSALILTDDRQALLEAVSQGDDRLTASELVSQREPQRATRELPVPVAAWVAGRSDSPAAIIRHSEGRAYDHQPA